MAGKSLTKDFHRLMRRIGKLTEGQASIDNVNWEDGTLTSFGVTIRPNASYYKGGRFKFTVHLPEEFAFGDPPCVWCETDIYHPNIDNTEAASDPPRTNVCLNIFEESSWNQAHGLEGVVLGLLFLMHNPNINDPLSPEFEGGISEDTFRENVNDYLAGKPVEGEYDHSIDFRVIDGEFTDLTLIENNAGVEITGKSDMACGNTDTTVEEIVNAVEDTHKAKEPPTEDIITDTNSDAGDKNCDVQSDDSGIGHTGTITDNNTTSIDSNTQPVCNDTNPTTKVSDETTNTNINGETTCRTNSCDIAVSITENEDTETCDIEITQENNTRNIANTHDVSPSDDEEDDDIMPVKFVIQANDNGEEYFVIDFVGHDPHTDFEEHDCDTNNNNEVGDDATTSRDVCDETGALFEDNVQVKFERSKSITEANETQRHPGLPRSVSVPNDFQTKAHAKYKSTIIGGQSAFTELAYGVLNCLLTAYSNML